MSSPLEHWLSLDFDQATREEASNFSPEDVTNHLNPNKRLTFGTAGLRARMGAGFDRMNCLTVMQASQGICMYLLSTYGEDALKEKGVVIGYDGRHNSRKFAHVAAAVFISKGGKVYLFDKSTTCTPFTPYLVKRNDCLCGAQVTASHNPKDDNGFKVYARNGAQIAPPVDEEIAEKIADNLTPWKDALDLLDLHDTGLLKSNLAVIEPFDDVFKSYMDRITGELCRLPELNKNCQLTYVYTAMHGVGLPFTTGLIKHFGFPEGTVSVLESQALPDPEFPTVKFPNPEEKGALDLALAEAKQVDADYVIANDPDADRFTACEKQADGTWHQFSGDELGVLFGDWQILMAHKRGVPAENCLTLASTVSSKMLAALTKYYCGTFVDTLTGFKWLANTSLKMTAEDPDLVHCLAYEEAIGYALTMTVPDKDGVSAAAVWCEMSNYWRVTKGLSMNQRLEQIRQTVGYFVTDNGYYICSDPKVMKAIFDEFRNNGEYKKNLGAHGIASIRDVTLGYDSRMVGKKSTLPVTPNDQMITVYFDNDAIVTLRGSGTEPKLKYYAELRDLESTEKARSRLAGVMKDVDEFFLQPQKYGLTRR
ncbi:Phosphoglucomutase-2 [Perkinsus chesapeaki]|uniref:Phosphoglucomutase-2 n=1 Tax=Perkinsus chesapeaki TaxID=330153 RepID=A0A7J6LGF0_PERCH|nr:Phosphoglucomutase-2 [Perkinsus chesapeaki]